MNRHIFVEARLSCILDDGNRINSQVDTFEYRLLRETEFRESITRRFVGESDVQISTVVDRNLGPVAPPQITQKPRNSKLVEGSDAVFTAKISGNPKPRVSERFLKLFTEKSTSSFRSDKNRSAEKKD